MTEVEAAVAVPKEEEPQDEDDKEDSVYSDPNGENLNCFCCFRSIFNGGFAVAVIVSFLDQFGTMVFSDKCPVMSDLMEWISNTDEGEFQSKIERNFKSRPTFSDIGASGSAREASQEAEEIGEPR
jgi:hypothetical protein